MKSSLQDKDQVIFKYKTAKVLNEVIFIIIAQRIFYILFQIREVEGGFICQLTSTLSAANANSNHQNVFFYVFMHLSLQLRFFFCPLLYLWSPSFFTNPSQVSAVLVPHPCR